MIKHVLLLLAGCILVFCFSFCESGNNNSVVTASSDDTVQIKFNGNVFKVESRDQSLIRLQQKMKSKKPLVVHVLVPLCDNENQGIVPVNKQLGDGMNLKTNLYWGAGYGIKSYFKKYGGWKLMHSVLDSSATVLERCVFYKKNAKGTEIYLVADAYRGDKMKECLHDFFRSLGGWKNETDTVSGKNLSLYSGADLLVFNGHDGLMDDTVKMYYSKDSVEREAVSISCYSKHFFNPYYENCGAYPLTGTSGLLAPEAYVLAAIIDSWAELKSANEIRIAAGDGYYSKHPKSTQSGARGLFTSGW